MEGVLQKLSDLGANYDKKALEFFRELEERKGEALKETDFIKAIQEPTPTLEGLLEFQFNPTIIDLIYQLNEKAPVIRKVRGDGNCLYRSIGYALLETVFATGDNNKFFVELLNKTNEKLFDFYKEMPKGVKSPGELYRYFIDYMMKLAIYSLEYYKHPRKIIDKLELLINHTKFDVVLVSFIRALAWNAVSEIKKNPNKDVDLFEKIEVLEPEIGDIRIYGTEGEQIISNILAKSFGFQINIFYLEKNQLNKEQPVIFEDTHRSIKEEPKLEISLYFRPGHYQICFKKDYAIKIYPDIIEKNSKIEEKHLQEMQKEEDSKEYSKDIDMKGETSDFTFKNKYELRETRTPNRINMEGEYQSYRPVYNTQIFHHHPHYTKVTPEIIYSDPRLVYYPQERFSSSVITRVPVNAYIPTYPVQMTPHYGAPTYHEKIYHQPSGIIQDIQYAYKIFKEDVKLFFRRF